MKVIQQMFEHLSWANKRIFETLEQSKNRDAERLFSHILLAEKVWITRIQGKDSSQLSIWSDIELDACKELMEENNKFFQSFLAKLTLEELENKISYSNSKGEAFTNTLGEILTHLGLHGQYHRGQVNTKLRASNQEPISVDFITFFR